MFRGVLKQLTKTLFAILGSVSIIHAQIDVDIPGTDPAAVGRVSLVLGRAYQTRGKNVTRVSAGQSVFVGDRIYTELNGHVHIQFIDEALVSVRPSSTLDIELYQYNESEPESSAVRFSLTEGVARSISGKAAKAARERYRLNTPIAAIGVRGTDFVVAANSSSTRALVNEGSIVLAPFSLGCIADGLGPCLENSVELAASSFQAIELAGKAMLPEIKSPRSPSQARDFQDRFQLSQRAVSPASEDASENGPPQVFLESVASGTVTEANASISAPEFRDYTPDFPINSPCW